MRRRITLFLAVLGPGLIAGLSDDDPAGITTYAVMGADHGYGLLWVLVVATGMLVLYHLLGVRIGAATGQGLIGLVRERYGVRVGGAEIAVDAPFRAGDIPREVGQEVLLEVPASAVQFVAG